MEDNKINFEDRPFTYRLKRLIRLLRTDSNVRTLMFFIKLNFIFSYLFPKVYNWEKDKMRQKRKRLQTK